MTKEIVEIVKLSYSKRRGLYFLDVKDFTPRRVRMSYRGDSISCDVGDEVLIEYTNDNMIHSIKKV